jgi:hypothetical protein
MQPALADLVPLLVRQHPPGYGEQPQPSFRAERDISAAPPRHRKRLRGDVVRLGA